MKPAKVPIPLSARVLPWFADRTAGLVRRAFRIRVSRAGFEPAKFASGPLVIAANHRSVLDAVLLRYVLPPQVRRRTVTIGARDFFAPAPTDRGARWVVRAVLCAYVVRAYRVCLIGRGDDMGDGVPAIMQAIEQGWNVILFPEGTRSRTGQMGRFRTGVAHIARATGAGVLPVWIAGTEDLLPVGARWLRTGAASLRAGEAIRVSEGESNRQFLDRMRAKIEELDEAGE